MDDIQIKRLSDFNTQLRIKGFNVYQVQNDSYYVRSHHKRVFFKICMDTGTNIIHFADRSYEINGTVLFITSPQVPYVWESNASVSDGYACLFNEQFLNSLYVANGGEPTLFKQQKVLIYELDNNTKELFLSLFKNLSENQEMHDAEHMDLIRAGIRYLLHETEMLTHVMPQEGQMDPKERIALVFTDFLERQFPLTDDAETLKYTDIAQYAKAMNILPEELNAAVYEVKQRYPAELFYERLMAEAHHMLSVHNKDHTTVARQLGFDHSENFMDSYHQWIKERTS